MVRKERSAIYLSISLRSNNPNVCVAIAAQLYVYSSYSTDFLPSMRLVDLLSTSLDLCAWGMQSKW